MRTIDLCAAVALCIVPSSQLAADEVSVERGLYISIIGGFHFCHTEGYRAAEGKIDPEKALKGSSVGWRGPWGTTYISNAQKRSWPRFLAKIPSRGVSFYCGLPLDAAARSLIITSRVSAERV